MLSPTGLDRVCPRKFRHLNCAWILQLAVSTTVLVFHHASISAFWFLSLVLGDQNLFNIWHLLLASTVSFYSLCPGSLSRLTHWNPFIYLAVYHFELLEMAALGMSSMLVKARENQEH